jgi:hypothetical protein
MTRSSGPRRPSAIIGRAPEKSRRIAGSGRIRSAHAVIICRSDAAASSLQSAGLMRI